MLGCYGALTWEFSELGTTVLLGCGDIVRGRRKVDANVALVV